MFLKNLVKISNFLDEKGHFECADSIDQLSEKIPMLESEHGKPIEGIIVDVLDKDEHGHSSKSKNPDSYMTLPLLKKIRDLSNSMCSMIDEDDKVEDWIESYVSQMSKMMDDVHTAWKYRYKK